MIMNRVNNERKNMWAVLSVSFMSFVGILTETSLNVTFPTMMKQFGVDLDTIQWTSTGYLLAIAIIMICSSYLNKRFTAKQIFIAACAGFMVGSLISAFAPNFPCLLLGRLFSALGAGLSTPLMFNLISEIMPRQKWGLYMGIAGLVVAMAPTLGPAFGGIINFYFSWRLIFVIVTFFALIVCLVGIMVIGKYHEQEQAKFDWLSFIFLASALIVMTLTLNQISSGLGKILFWLLLAVTIVLFVLFYYSSQKSQKKLLNLLVFKQKGFIFGVVAYFLFQFINIGVSFVLPNYIQIVGHQSSLVGGLMLLPGSIIAGLLSPWFGQIYDRKGAKLPLYVGGILMTASCLAFTLFGYGLTALMIVFIYTIESIAHRLSFSNTLAEALKLQPKKLRADATAICQTAQQLAGSMGTIILAAIIAIWQKQGSASYAVRTAQGSTAAFAFTFLAGLVILINYFCLFRIEKRAK